MIEKNILIVFTKDIFYLRLQRTINAYRKISIGGFILKGNGISHDVVELRIYPLNNFLSEVRFGAKIK